MITLPGQLSHGMPPGSTLSEHARSLKDLQRQVDELKAAAAQSNVTQQVSWSNAITLPASDPSYYRYNATPGFIVPANCTRLTWSMSMAVDFQAAPTVNYVYVVSQAFSLDNVTWTNPPNVPYAAMHQNAGGGGQSSAVSVTAGTVTGLVPGSSVYWANEVAYNATTTASPQASIYGVLIWSRS